MALSIFEDKSKVPGNGELAKVLDSNFELWNKVKNFVILNYPAAKEEWNYSGKNYGWGFRLRDPKRVIVYMTPCDGFFKTSFVLGERAFNEALDTELSDETLFIIKTAKTYAEGTGVRIDIKDEELIEDVKKLIKIKLKY
jgi:hypothetical protein